jgi:hypothetical protein
MKRKLLIVLLSIISTGLYSQSVQYVTAKLVDNVVEISYQLRGESIKQFDVKLYVSKDNGKTFDGPLLNVSGDVGSKVSPGYKKIFWNPTKEGNYIDKDVVFKVEANYKKPFKPAKIDSFIGYDFLSIAPIGITKGRIGNNFGSYWSLKSGFRFGWDYATWLSDSLAGYIPLIHPSTYSYTGSSRTNIASFAWGPTLNIYNLFLIHAGLGMAYRNTTQEIRINYSELANVRIIERSGLKFYYEFGAKILIKKYYIGLNIASVTPNLTQFGFTIGFLN